MSKEELLDIKAGASSASLINSIVKVFSLTLDLGKIVGKFIKSKTKGYTCS